MSSLHMWNTQTQDLRKLENFKKITEMLGFHGEDPAGHPRGKF